MAESVGTIEGVIRAHASSMPDASVLVSPGSAPLTYSALASEIVKTRKLVRNAGLSRSARIAIVLQDRPQALAAMLIFSNAATVTLLNPDSTQNELIKSLNGFRADLVVAPPDLAAPEAAALSLGLPLARTVGRPGAASGLFEIDIPQISAPVTEDGPVAGDDALVLMTSGTTARPKSVALTHEMMIDRARANTDTLLLRPDDVCINFRPAYLGGGINIGLMGSVLAGGSVVVPKDFDADDFFRLCTEYGVSWYAAGPAYHTAILERAPSHREIIANWRLRLVRSASYHLPEDLRERLERELGVRVIQKYGLTELSIIASEKVTDSGHRKNKVGRPYECEVRIVDANGKDCPPGVEGQILARGRRLFRGYDGDPDLTASAIIDGWLHTGDLGVLDTDGYLSVTGRMSDVINRGGQKVSPKEVEVNLAEHPEVSDCVCFAMPHRTLGQIAAVAVVLQPGATLTAAAISGFLRERLARYKVPDRIVFCDAIPRASGGKFKRTQAAELLRLPIEERRRDTDEEARRSPIENEIADIWREVLGLEFVRDDDNFVLLGGDSLQAMRMVASIEERLGATLSTDAIFGASATLRGMADEVEKLARNASSPARREPRREIISPRPDTTEAPLSFAQERMWFIAKADPSAMGLCGGNGLRLSGRVDPARMERAIGCVIERHESIRAYFPCWDGVPHQRFSRFEGFNLPVVDLRDHDASDRLRDTERRAYDLIKQPYDIENGPLYRFCLYILADDEAALVRCGHHLTNDGLSSGIIFDEIMQLYQAADFEAALARLPEPTPYGDYAHWQRGRLAGPELDGIVEFWKDTLDGAPPVTPLPLVRERPEVPDYKGGRHRVELPLALTDSLRNLAAREHTSLYVTTLAAFEALIHLTTGATDFIVGTGADIRPKGHRRSLVGYCFNLLPLRARTDGQARFTDLVAQVRDSVGRLMQNREVPFEQIMRIMNPPRTIRCHPVIQVLFGFIPKQRRSIDGAQYLTVDLERDTARFDLSLILEDIGDRVAGFVEYRADLFDAGAIETLVAAYYAVLEQVAAAPDTRLADLRLIEREEERRIAATLRGPSRPFQQAATIPELFVQIAEDHPHKAAVIHGEDSVSYAKLDAWSDAVAGRLVRHGVSPGDIVAISAERTAAFIAGILGILKTGAGYLPLDTSLPEPRQIQILNLAGARLCLAQQGTTLSDAVPTPRLALPPEPGDCDLPRLSFAKPDIATDLPAFVLFTSGSTGEPKGVVHGHRAVARQIADRKIARLGPDRVFLLLAPPTFDVATFEIWASLLNGGTLVLAPLPLPGTPELADLIRDQKITTLQMTPALFHLMLDTRSDAFDKVEQLLIGGDVMSADHVRRFLDRFSDCELINVYAPTEFSVWAVSHKVTSASPLTPVPPIGTPADNTYLRILDEGGKQVPTGVPGELCIGGPGLATGYLGNPALTAEKFTPDPLATDAGARIYRTGDLAVLRPDGEVDFIGRKDHQLKIRGFLVEPAEIVAALLAHSDVADAAVIAEEQPGGRKQLVAFAVPISGESDTDPLDVLHGVGKRLPQYMVPARLIWLEKLPLNRNNKLDRARLAQIARTAKAPQRISTVPGTELEKTIASIWCELLKLPSCGIDEPFFDLGGDSLLMMQMTFRVGAETGITIPPEIAFGRPNIRAIAAYAAQKLRGQLADPPAHDSRADPLLVPLTTPHFHAAPAAKTAPHAYIVSGGGGHVHPFALVAGALAPAWRTVGLLDPHFIQDEPRQHSIEALAERYIRAAQDADPVGPYYLIGYSFGGLVVHDMARQLHERGYRAACILLDTRLRLSRSPREKSRHLIRQAKQGVQSFLNGMGRYATPAPDPLNPELDGQAQITDDLNFRRRMLAHQRQLGRRYTPCPSPAPTFVIRAEDSWRSSDTEDYGWSAIAPVEGTLTVPGTHLTLFKGANEPAFVTALTEALERVRASLSNAPAPPPRRAAGSQQGDTRAEVKSVGAAR